jgi:CBS domain containing-hemolysin-like protein
MVRGVTDWFALLGIGVVTAALAGIFLCSLAEAALLGINDGSLRRLSESRDRAAMRVARLLNDGTYLSALIVGMNTFIIILSTVMTLLVHHHLGDGPGAKWAGEAWHIGMVLFILIFAELSPKTYGGLYPERVALRVSRPVTVITGLFRPLVVLLTRLSSPLTGHQGNGRHANQLLTVDEIRMAADVSEEDGLVEPEEAEMLDNVIDLGETLAREVMVPRVAVLAAEEDLSVPEFAAIASRSGFSRIPIYRETLDSVTGIVYVKDVLFRLGTGDRAFTLRDVARPPLYFPETKPVDDLLRELRDQRVHIAVVVDEFGGTAGLVTIEDILEELVGEIADEHDQPSDEIVRLSDRELLVDGRTRIEEINDLLEASLPDDQYETVGGLASGLAGRIPATGEAFQVEGIRLLIEESDGQHVGRVRVVVGTREDGDG